MLVRSDLIKHLSTGKVFGWATALGAAPMGTWALSMLLMSMPKTHVPTGIEWLNDTTLILIFPSAPASLLALSLLAKAGFDPSEGDDPLLPRSAHSFPVSLLPLREPEPVQSQAGSELLAATEDAEGGGVRKRGRGMFAGSAAGVGSRDLPALATGTVDVLQGVELAEGVDPNARVEVRFAVEEDGGLRAEAKQSDWYKRHGRGAGKETAGGRRSLPGRERDDGVSFEGRGLGNDGGELRRRIGRERAEPYRRDQRGGQGRVRGRRTEEDLDQELERIARARASGEDIPDVDMDEGGRNGHGRERGERGPRRERKGREDLDQGELNDPCVVERVTQLMGWAELDSMLASRRPAE